MTTTMTRITNLILFLVVILLFIVIIETTAFFIYDTTVWYTPDGDIGWKHSPNLNKTFYGTDYASHVITNSEGFPDRKHSLIKENDTTRIVILGDSFAEAFQVDFDKSFPRMIEKVMSNTEVLNFGVSSFGSDNEILTYTKYAQKYNPDIVVLVFSNNDVRDNYKFLYDLSPKIDLMKEKPFFIDENGILTPKNFSVYEKPWIKSLLSKSHFLAFLNNLVFKKKSAETRLPEGYKVFSEQYNQDWNNAWNITLKLLKELNQKVTRHNATFIMLIGVDAVQISNTAQQKLFVNYLDAKNYSFDFNKPTNILQEFCKTNKVTCISLPQYFKDANETLFVEDGHWNEKGHRIVANVLIRYLTALISKSR